MSEQLAEEGWLAPAHPGPTRRMAIACVATGVIVLAAWFFATMFWRAPIGSGSELVEIQVNDAGRAIITSEQKDLKTEVRSSRGVDYLAVHASTHGAAFENGTRDITPLLPSGVDGDRVTLRVVGPTDDVRITRDELGVPHATVRLGGAEEDLRILLVIPASMLALPADKARSVGPLSKVTRPLDDDARATVADIDTLKGLRDKASWLLPITLLASVGVPLLLWRRARRAFFSMRRPGPGTQQDPAPPSSLDPVGAAVLVAGARPVDATAAFAGHVLDLVERRQLQIRRTMDPTPGTGALIGLGRADELDDIAVHALRTTTFDDEGLTVAVPDSLAKTRRVAEPERDAWHLHVAARERFEGVVDHLDTRRLLVAAVLLGLVTLAGLVAGLVADLPGRRAQLWLASAALLPATAVVLLWLRDARRWRIVTRGRRTERAQWLAWRTVVGTADGPALDQRNLPVIAATGATSTGIRGFAGPDAVGLDAVTTKTIATLCAMVADSPPS